MQKQLIDYTEKYSLCTILCSLYIRAVQLNDLWLFIINVWNIMIYILLTPPDYKNLIKQLSAIWNYLSRKFVAIKIGIKHYIQSFKHSHLNMV